MIFIKKNNDNVLTNKSSCIVVILFCKMAFLCHTICVMKDIYLQNNSIAGAILLNNTTMPIFSRFASTIRGGVSFGKDSIVLSPVHNQHNLIINQLKDIR